MHDHSVSRHLNRLHSSKGFVIADQVEVIRYKAESSLEKQELFEDKKDFVVKREDLGHFLKYGKVEDCFGKTTSD